VTLKRPVIGVPVCQLPASFANDPAFPANTEYYIEEAYVKLVESAGGRVFPLFTANTTDYRYFIKKINGLLVPSCAGDAAHEAWTEDVVGDILKRNDRGWGYIPVLGIGSGMHRMTNIFYPATATSHPLEQTNVALTCTADAATSDLFSGYKV